MKLRVFLPCLIALLLLLLAACSGQASQPAAHVRIYPVMAASTPTPTLTTTPTPTPDLAATAQVTLQAIALAQQNLHATATVAAFQAQQAALQMTQAAARQTARAEATGHALAVRATATAQALLFAREAHQATQAVQSTATANAFQATLAAHAAQATETAWQAQWEARHQAALRRSVRDWSLTLALALLAVGGVLMLLRVAYHRLGTVTVTPAPNGDAPLILFPNGQVYDPDRNPYPLLPAGSRTRAWLATLPQELLHAALQRDQTTDLARSAPRHKSASTRPNTDIPPFQIIRSGERPALLDGDTLAVLEAVWREANEQP